MKWHPRDTSFGAHARAGYQWEIFGFDAGATAFQGHHLESEATTLRRPGAYVGADVALGKLELQARVGAFRAGPSLADDANTRADVALYVPITEPLSLRIGGSFSGNEVGLGGEGSAGLRLSL